MATVSIAARFKNALLALMQTVQYDAGSGADRAFQEVTGSLASDFDTSPNLQVLPGDVSDGRVTSAQTERVVRYVLRTRLALEDSAKTQDEIVDHMYALTDLIIDTVDLADQNSSLGDGQGEFPSYFMDATRGDWITVETPAGSHLDCDIDVKITYSKNLT